MDALSKVLRVVATIMMALVVAGFMLAFINSDEHAFFLSILFSPVALIFFGASTLLNPDRHQNGPGAGAVSS
jgi:hypothetical protein